MVLCQWAGGHYFEIHGRRSLAAWPKPTREERSVYDLVIRGGTVVPAADTMRCDVAVRDGRLANETPLSLALLPAAGTQAMAESNRAVSIALEALNPLRVERFSAQVDMADDGWLLTYFDEDDEDEKAEEARLAMDSSDSSNAPEPKLTVGGVIHQVESMARRH